MDAERTAVRIFDLIDARQISQAGCVLETALQKFPDDESLCAAEALIIMRSGNYRLAKAKAIALSERGVTRPKAVNALVHVLQNCCCWDALAATYERLSLVQKDRQISENLVQTYARMGAYARVQQTATQLYRQYSDPKYQVWMVQAMLAQVPDGSRDHMLLRLSAKLLDAAVLTEKGLVVPSTVQTYVDVLAQQRQYDAAVSFLLSERAAKIGLLATRLETLARMLQRAGRTSEANAVAQYLWREQRDNWIPFTIYKETLVPATGVDKHQECSLAPMLVVHSQAAEMCATIDCAQAHHSLEEAVQLARQLQEEEEWRNPDKLRRGPYLAELDLLHSLRSADMLERVLAYVKRFYRKPSCYLDISTFLTPEISAGVHEWVRRSTSVAPQFDVDVHKQRILGLRCLVGSWETIPPGNEPRALFSECLMTYLSSRCFSTRLLSSEEGTCDGYITVALNIALRGYAADKDCPDHSYLVEGLDLMSIVDRRMNNPTWLTYAVCFANLLGLTDCEALHQLAFKNVQRDTMAHVGYWPLLTGLALEDVAKWDGWAEDYYSMLGRDCSLLRAKVFNYTSWPAMQDVQRFEESQTNSLYRWQCPANECTSALLECQTQKDVNESLKARIEALWAAWERLSATDAAATLADNTDWVVAKSMVLGNIHSTTVQQLTEALVSVPSRDWQVRRSRQLLASLILLHDMAAVSAHRQAASQVSKSRKGKGASAGSDAAPAAAAPVLYSSRLAASSASVEYLPAVQPLASVLRDYVDSLGEASPQAAIASAELRTYLKSLVAESQHSSGAFEVFLYPQGYILSALLKMAPAAKLPVKEWATDVRETLEAAQCRYESRSWSTLATNVGQTLAPSARALESIRLAPGNFTAKLEREKVQRIIGYLSSLKVEMGACAR
ncbi:hypothetical protein LSCM1_03673 [Leishmania martiniquensis]|uniref:N-acetyltransferase B complex (NatB) non catalytic subunit n=1 Tax=Leishmania martiniquensis TaxID=1580590 RepID=A0A836GEW9_9TRYP|nr:hypothetical protein LSCM1_03673 [Leishmania martiniquensis]